MFRNEYVFSIITKILMVIIGMLSSVLIARYLGSILKGEIAVITSITSITSILCTLGVHQAYPFYKKNSNNSKDTLSNFMTSLYVIFFVYIILASILCFILGKNNTIFLSSIIIITLLMGYSRIVSYIFLVESPNKRNFTMMLINIFEVIYISILFTFSNSNLILGLSIIMFKDILQSIYYTKKLDFKLKIKNIRSNVIFSFIKYGFYPMIALLMATLNYRIDILMLNNFENVTYSDIGIYSVGVGLAEKLWILSDAVKDILLSRLANGTDDYEVTIVMRISFFLSIFMVLGIMVFGYPFISILYGAEFKNAYFVTIIIIIGILSMVFYKIISTYNIVNGKQKLNVILLSGAIFTNIIMNALFIPLFGYLGAAIASVGSYTLCAILFLFNFSKNSGIEMKKLVFIQKEDILMLKAMINKI